MKASGRYVDRYRHPGDQEAAPQVERLDASAWLVELG